MDVVEIEQPLSYWGKLKAPSGYVVYFFYRQPPFSFDKGDFFILASAISAICRRGNEWLTDRLRRAHVPTYRAATGDTAVPEQFIRTNDVERFLRTIISGGELYHVTRRAQQILDWWVKTALPQLKTSGTSVNSTFTLDDTENITTQADKLIAAGVPKNTAFTAAVKIRAKETGKDFAAIVKLVEIVLK